MMNQKPFLTTPTPINPNENQLFSLILFSIMSHNNVLLFTQDKILILCFKNDLNRGIGKNW